MFQKLVPGWKQRFNRKVADGEAAFKSEFEQYSTVMRGQQERLSKLQEEADKHNRKIIRFRESYRAGRPEAVATFFASIFENSDYPEKFPNKWQLRYAPDSRHLIVNFDLPTIDDIVPFIERYKYIKSSDEIGETKKAQKARQNLYAGFVPKIVLRRLYEVFASDCEKVVDVVTVSAFVQAVDPSTGQRVQPCLVSVRTTRDEFEKLDLRHVDPIACLKRLNATVSRSPSELVAVKPIMELNMVDPRFIHESDVLSELDTRPNLMELTPGEFENLITNLFQRMGLETRLTQASRDGGVDCVAFDPRPVLGGKVVVQAKRYKNTVGVSAVRDLFGTMHN
jgi:restriction system protein